MKKFWFISSGIITFILLGIANNRNFLEPTMENFLAIFFSIMVLELVLGLVFLSKLISYIKNKI